MQATEDWETLKICCRRCTISWTIICAARGLEFTSIRKMDCLSQGAQGYQLTWMDAKVGDWVVTPRRGKAVEINALWYNALRLLEGWSHRAGDDVAAAKLAQCAEQACVSFNRRFW